jgi:hypothetical protein
MKSHQEKPKKNPNFKQSKRKGKTFEVKSNANTLRARTPPVRIQLQFILIALSTFCLYITYTQIKQQN